MAKPAHMPNLCVVRPGRHGQTARRHIRQMIQRGAQQGGGRLVLPEIVPDEGGGTLQHDALEEGGEGEDGQAVEGILLQVHQAGQHWMHGLAASCIWIECDLSGSANASVDPDPQH
jgi:hypothetical protein